MQNWIEKCRNFVTKLKKYNLCIFVSNVVEYKRSGDVPKWLKGPHSKCGRSGNRRGSSNLPISVVTEKYIPNKRVDFGQLFYYTKCTKINSTLSIHEENKGKENAMIIIDYQDRRPLYEQIVEKLQMLIIKGVLEPNSQLPSVRKLAMELSINPNTIQRAYAVLEQQGFIYPVKGRGNFVSPDLKVMKEKKKLYYGELSKLVHQGKAMGITVQEMTEQISKMYEEEDV